MSQYNVFCGLEVEEKFIEPEAVSTTTLHEVASVNELSLKKTSTKVSAVTFPLLIDAEFPTNVKA